MAVVVAHFHAARRVAGRRDGLLDAVDGPAQVFADHVGRDRHDAPLVDAVVFLRHGAVGDLGHVAQQRGGLVLVLLDGDHAHFGLGVHLGGRHLQLHLIADAALGIGPVNRNDVTAGGGGGDHGVGRLGHGQAGQAGPFPIDLHLDARIIERLAELQIAQGRNLAHLGDHLLGVLPVFFLVGAADDHLDRRRRAEAHDLVDHVGRLERDGHLLGALRGNVRRRRRRPSSCLASQGLNRSGNSLRSCSLTSSVRKPFSSLRAMRMTA